MVPLITLAPGGANTTPRGATGQRANNHQKSKPQQMNHTFYTNYIPAPIGSTGDDCGSLHLLATGEFLRRATEAEAQASEAEGSVHGCTGAILVDGLTCYVQP